MRPAMNRRLGALLVALGLLASLASATPVLAASITVNSLADTAADDGSCTLREAITAANTDAASGASPGECVAGSGADDIGFGVPGTITLGSSLPTISTNLAIDGAGVITISGNSLHQVLLITDGSVDLVGLTITEGATAPLGRGAGISITGGTLDVTNTAFVDNAAGLAGGGIYNDGGDVSVAGSSMVDNTAGGGGGIHNQTGTMNVTTSIFTDGTAVTGGGIRSDGGSVTVSDSTFSGNSASNLGGAIFNQGTLTITNSTFSANTAVLDGGGIENRGTLTVNGSTFSGNSAVGDGGGLLNRSSLEVANSTIAGNTAASGGGIYDSDAGTLGVTNSTISGNAAGGSGGGILAEGNETLANSIVAGNTAGSMIGDDIDFFAETVTTSVIGVPVGLTLDDILVAAGPADNGGPTQTIALALVAGNPAIDAGDAATCAAAPIGGVDQRGLPRPAACDIGAYEAQPPTVAAHANVSATATSALAGAIVTYATPAGTDEQGGNAPVACLPASGSTFPVGSTTVTCTATDAVGHTGTGTFAVTVSAPAATPIPTPTATPGQLPNTAAMGRPDSMLGKLGALALISLLGLLAITHPFSRSRVRRVLATVKRIRDSD